MTFRTAASVILVLSVTSAIAQSAPQAGTAPRGTDVTAQGNGAYGQRNASLGAMKSRSVQSPTPLRQRVEDLESTVNRMHEVLNQMQTKVAKSSVKDSLTKTNLDMWELMMGHLDKDLQDLRLAVAAREDMEARRVALYKQADQKAEAEAQAARAAQATKFGVSTQAPESAAQGGGQSPANQAVAGQSSTRPAVNATSPN